MQLRGCSHTLPHAPKRSHTLSRHAVAPLLQCPDPVELVTSEYEDDQSQQSFATLTAVCTPQADDGTGLTGSEDRTWIFESFKALVQFLYAHVFDEDASLLHRFLEHFWPPCASQGADALAPLAHDPPRLQACVEVRCMAMPAHVQCACVC
jgi:hypothetical protein